MYQKVRKGSNSGLTTPQYVYDSKKVTPMHTQRIKKGSINSLLASNGQKSNKTAGPRILNLQSGNTSVNQSSKQTPTKKSRKNSISSIVMNKENQIN